jgi:ABC-type multidrug transport system ATPase subunit
MSKAFGERVILRKVELTVAPGEVCAVRGRNGAGKTTLIRLLATTVLPDEGQVWINGYDTRRQARSAKASIGLALVNERSLQWRLNAVQNLALWASVRGLRKPAASSAIARALEGVGLTPQARLPVAQLSSGQRHRLVLARALLTEPPVLLIDEPLRGLDEESIARVLSVLRTRATAGTAVLVAAPKLDELANLADSFYAVSEQGELVTTTATGAT